MVCSIFKILRSQAGRRLYRRNGNGTESSWSMELKRLKRLIWIGIHKFPCASELLHFVKLSHKSYEERLCLVRFPNFSASAPYGNIIEACGTGNFSSQLEPQRSIRTCKYAVESNSALAGWDLGQVSLPLTFSDYLDKMNREMIWIWSSRKVHVMLNEGLSQFLFLFKTAWPVLEKRAQRNGQHSGDLQQTCCSWKSHACAYFCALGEFC